MKTTALGLFWCRMSRTREAESAVPYLVFVHGAQGMETCVPHFIHGGPFAISGLIKGTWKLGRKTSREG